MQFAVLSDVNATDFNSIVSVPVFREPAPGRPAWVQMQAGAQKHDTFVFDASGARVLAWDASAEDLSMWSADIRAAVEAAR
ncbi:MAG: hypothetical protein H0V17_13460 [Deltaproteobacteria bacterium]|nr:hypothetical protein [Deltaproteobacteria bacterium]